MVQEEVGKYAGFLKIKQSNNTEMICLLSEVFVTHSGVIKKKSQLAQGKTFHLVFKSLVLTYNFL